MQLSESGPWPPAAAADAEPETLLFTAGGVYTIDGPVDVGSPSGPSNQGPPLVPSAQLPLSTPLSDARCAAHEPTSDCVLFALGSAAIGHLDGRNGVSLIAGNQYTKRGSGVGGSGGGGDGAGSGTAARFYNITALVPDGKGSVYVGDHDRIRRLHVASRQVTTLPGSAPGSVANSAWVGLSYDAEADHLLAATEKAVCIVEHAATAAAGDSGSSGAAAAAGGAADAGGNGAAASGGGSGGGMAAVRLVAGDWQAAGFVDAAGTAARFTEIAGILAGADRRLYILDGGMLRVLEGPGSGYFVSTALTGTYTGATPSCLSFLPPVSLAIGYAGNTSMSVISGPRVGPSSPALGGYSTSSLQRQGPSAAAIQLHKALVAAPSPPSQPSTSVDAGGADDNAKSGGEGGAELGIGVTVRVGGGVRFLAHRAALTSRSDYFRQLLDPDGGFADSGAARGEVSLPEAHPEAFSWLLVYMYGGELYVPYELLHPAAELATRLLMPAECTAQLQEWLLAAVTPGSVVSELIWAERCGMAELVPRLKAYLLWHRLEVTFGDAVGELAARCPDLAASLLKEMAAAV
ncbi:Ankyrin repeat and BTB/POZ domain-containing protein 1 [Pleodorina starrii]|uniref:Ankyrin repeat and BTB/POZ domain-containing protein 1 n=1 Tax=Pleodorina starrii TaxID=330485 RepID=A0A9W6BVQ0_9CHLO|nr:Ankyrin repeat and BTB/POZ domain-containing protein 1 [Pleodorina starrii]